MIEHRLIDRMVNLLKIESNNIMTENDIDDTFLLGVIDFFRTYADKNHHGKEEDILFKKLDKKNISFELRRILVKLTEDHKIARKMIWALDAARGKHSQKLNNFTKEISLIIKEIVELYQKHIEIEDKYFFIPSMKYFTTQEQEEMLREFIDFDRNSNLTRYIYLVEQFENSKLQNIKILYELI